MSYISYIYYIHDMDIYVCMYKLDIYKLLKKVKRLF